MTYSAPELRLLGPAETVVLDQIEGNDDDNVLELSRFVELW